ncbi:hypothetical protein FBY35_5167 [Streptomyces sp. SLBN-118]|uniref:hypothetical protein n=1 Tax=Streptomyces sp. SLBN-118 TaxID=2768454 RepID=UPI00116C50EC|nr:hypothetical protein [Streptomyces sp. SLBN-118]TQK43694.1 hypothetical protein FBY35_5167 [Streptomyces sp. SLBN-118]
MTTADAVRRRLGLGRLLPLGEAADGAWLAEQAAETVLRSVATGVPGVAPGRLRLALVDPDAAGPPAVPPPPSALPPGPLRIEADFAAVAWEPLPVAASVLRASLFTAAENLLDLRVSEVDLLVTDVLDAGPEIAQGAPPPEVQPAAPKGPVGWAASGAPGVAHLTATLGTAVHFAPDHVRVEVATASGHRPLEVVRAVREAVTAALADGRPVSVLVTAVEA